MALTTVPKFSWGPGADLVGAEGQWAAQSVTINDNDIYVAAIYVAPKDGSIDRIRFRTGTKVGTSTLHLLNISIVTVDTTTGLPTSTPLGGASIETRSISAITSNAFNTVTLTTPATMTRGQVFGIKIWAEGSQTFDASNSVPINARWTSGPIISPYEVDTNASGVATRNAVVPLLNALYSDGEPVRFPVSTSTVTSAAYTNATTPNEVGAVFTIPFGARCIGAGLYCRIPLASTGRMGLYDDTASLIASCSYGGGMSSGSSNYGAASFPFDPCELTTGVTYRLCNLATSADSRTHLEFPVAAVEDRAFFKNGESWYRTSRTNSGDTGSFTNDTLKVPMFWLELDQIDLSVTEEIIEAGSGGSVFF